ncbi:hypothetical protein PMAYCL1PPCAC_10399, partial [Pristionchus mayeri]
IHPGSPVDHHSLKYPDRKLKTSQMRDHNGAVQQDATTSAYESTDSIGGSSTATLDRDSSSGISSNSSTLSMEGCYDNPVLSIEDDVSARGIRLGAMTVSACSSATNSLPSTSRDLNQNDLPRAERADKRMRKFGRIPWIVAIAENVDSDPMMSQLEVEKRPSCVPAYILIFLLLFLVLSIGAITTIMDVRPVFIYGPKPANTSFFPVHSSVLDKVLESNSTLIG